MNIEKTLAACRAELTRQQEMEKAATPGPWWRGYISNSFNSIFGGVKDALNRLFVSSFSGTMSSHSEIPDMDLVLLSRNLNPARLATAKELMDAGEGDWRYWVSHTPEGHDPASNCSDSQLAKIRVAAALLGVEIIQ
jgi:hypothetical protein